MKLSLAAIQGQCTSLSLSTTVKHFLFARILFLRKFVRAQRRENKVYANNFYVKIKEQKIQIAKIKFREYMLSVGLAKITSLK